MTKARDVSRAVDDYASYLIRVNGLENLPGRYRVASEQLIVQYDSGMEEHYVMLSTKHYGEVISLVVDGNAQDGAMVLDGLFNTYGEKIAFLKGEPFYLGNTAYVKYLAMDEF